VLGLSGMGGGCVRGGLSRRLIASLRGLFPLVLVLVLASRAGRQNPLHKVFGPPGD